MFLKLNEKPNSIEIALKTHTVNNDKAWKTNFFPKTRFLILCEIQVKQIVFWKIGLNCFFFCFFFPGRNARAPVLQGLQQRQAVGTQCGHVQVFRFGHRRRHWSQRGHHGSRILYDAQGKCLHSRDNTIRCQSNEMDTSIEFRLKTIIVYRLLKSIILICISTNYWNNYYRYDYDDVAVGKNIITTQIYFLSLISM